MKKDNKGFSLVELIIVIAIMAILVGIVGSQVLPYLNKSREAKDQQILSGWVTSALSSYSSNAADLTDSAYEIVITVDKANHPGLCGAATVTGGSTTPVDKNEILKNAFNQLAACNGVQFSSTLYKTLSGVTIRVTPTNEDGDGYVVKISELSGLETDKGSISTTELVAK